MSILRAIVGGIIGAVVGYLAAAFLSNIVMGWYGVSDFEGGRGMAAVFGFGPIGGLAGLIGGIWLGLRLGGKQPIGRTLRRAGIALLAILAIAGAGLAIQYYSIPHRLEYDEAGASLEFELRAPASFAMPEASAIDITLDTDLNQQPGIWNDSAPHLDEDWQVLSGTVELYYRTSQRFLVFRFPDGRDRLFRPELAAKPDPEQGWSAWRKVDFVGLPDQPQTVQPGPEDPLELRYRVRVWGSE
ncbi:hypothetical protein [Dongia deserti]|uniref:hypothetical protein n=1 Tax=Dongia deserti TaxID=2268030 RepID=UPI000E652E60|nr:hypothetical protein [Dongia deserti]